MLGTGRGEEKLSFASKYSNQNNKIRGNIEIKIADYDYLYCSIIRFDNFCHVVPYLASRTGQYSMMFKMKNVRESEMWRKYIDELEYTFKYGTPIQKYNEQTFSQ